MESNRLVIHQKFESEDEEEEVIRFSARDSVCVGICCVYYFFVWSHRLLLTCCANHGGLPVLAAAVAGSRVETTLV